MNLKTSNLHSPTQEPIPQKGEIHLINPQMEEFKTMYLDDKNKSVEVVLAPLETKAFPIGTGKIILKHLMDFVLNQAGFSYKTDVNLKLAEIRKKCVVYE